MIELGQEKNWTIKRFNELIYSNIKELSISQLSQLTLQQIKSLQPEQSGPRVFSELLQKLEFCFRGPLVVGCKRFEAPEKSKY